jgi:hypothetical protein
MDFIKENNPLSEAMHLILILKRAVSAGDECVDIVKNGLRGLKSNGTKTYAKTIHPVPMGVSVAGVALS